MRSEHESLLPQFPFYFKDTGLRDPSPRLTPRSGSNKAKGPHWWHWKRLFFYSANDDSAKRYLFCRILLRDDHCFPLDSGAQRAVQGGFSTTSVSRKEEPLWTLDNILVTCPLSYHTCVRTEGSAATVSPNSSEYVFLLWNVFCHHHTHIQEVRLELARRDLPPVRCPRIQGPRRLQLMTHDSRG